MEFKSFNIGKYTIEKPIVQGGMGVGISWDQLAGNVSKEGGLGVISAVGTGVYKKRAYVEKTVGKEERPLEAINFYSYPALKKIFENAREICGDAPLAANVLYAQSEYDPVVEYAEHLGFKKCWIQALRSNSIYMPDFDDSQVF